MILANGAELVIRKAVRQDAGPIIEYLNLVGGESDNLLFGRDGFPMSVEDEERFILEVNSSKSSALFVGVIGEEIVCVGSILAPMRERIAHQADIALSVKKAYWHRGIGKSLMNALIDFAKSTGQTEILHLGVRAENVHAIALYQKLGFQEIGRYPRFFKIGSSYDDEILMNLYL